MGIKLSFRKALAFSLVLVTVPFSFAKNSKTISTNLLVKADSSSNILTPLSKQEIFNFQEGDSGYYLMCLLDGDTLGLLTFDMYGNFHIEEVSYETGYTIDINNFFRSAINGMLEMNVYNYEDYSSGDSSLAMNIASLEFCKNFHYTDQEYNLTLSFSDYGYPIFYSEGTEGVHLNTYTYGSGNKTDLYFAYEPETEGTIDTFHLTADKASDIFFYRLSDTFTEINSWQKKFLAITENSNPQNLINMWQGLSFYDKRYILERFHLDDPTGSSTIDYGTDGKEKEMNVLLDQFELFTSLTSSITQTPFRCMDADSNIEIDYSHNVIKGLNGLDSFILANEDDTFYVEYNGKDYFSFNSPDYDFFGKEYDLYYCVDQKEYTYSENPIHLTFKSSNPNIQVLDSIPFATATTHIEDNDPITVEEIYSNSFVLDNIPEGFEFALLDVDCFESNLLPYESEQGQYYFLDTDLVTYISDDTTFDKAYGIDFTLHELEAETSYYLIYRLKETIETAPSYICGYFEIQTIGENESYIKEVEVSNYSLYTKYQNLDRFQDAIAFDKEHSNYFASFFEETYSFLSTSELVDIESFINQRSLEDRYYYEANLVLLLTYGDQLLTDRSISEFSNYISTFISNFEEGTFQYGEIDEYVDTAINSLDNLMELYALQEDAAKLIADYFNEVVNKSFNIDIPEDAWILLSKYVKLIYEASNEEEINQLISDFTSSIDALFLTNGEDNNG